MFLFSSIRGHFLRASRNESLSGFFFDKPRQISHSSPLAINTTPCLMYAMPIKRKKKMDPMALKVREMRKRKKIDKEIKRYAKIERIDKPTEELRLPQVLVENPESRVREIKLTKEEEVDGILLTREFSRARLKEAVEDRRQINCLLLSTKIALQELRKVSEELYQEAIKIDEMLLPFTFEGPRETPPIEGYGFVDGDYTDISRKWN